MPALSSQRRSRRRRDFTRLCSKNGESPLIISSVSPTSPWEGFSDGSSNQATSRHTYRDWHPTSIPAPLKGSCAEPFCLSRGMDISTVEILIWLRGSSWVEGRSTFPRCPGLLSGEVPLSLRIIATRAPQARGSHEAGLLRPEFTSDVGRRRNR